MLIGKDAAGIHHGGIEKQFEEFVAQIIVPAMFRLEPFFGVTVSGMQPFQYRR